MDSEKISYEEKMDWAMEELANTLHELGFDGERINDDELVRIAAKRLKDFATIVKSQMTPDIFKILINA